MKNQNLLFSVKNSFSRLILPRFGYSQLSSSYMMALRDEHRTTTSYENMLLDMTNYLPHMFIYWKECAEASLSFTEPSQEK